MGRHVDDFLAAYHAGRIIGDGAVAAMAEQALAADKAERDAPGRRRAAAASLAVRAAAELTDSDLYDWLYPTHEEAQRRGDALVAAAEARSREPLSDAEADALFAASPAHAAFTGTHSHSHAAYDGNGGQHSHAHTHQAEANHSHHEYGDSLPG